MKPQVPPISFLRRPQMGFSLLEMAVVLVIVGILMSGVLVSISQTTLTARRAAALAQLQQVEEALYGFAEANGRLPCPASLPVLVSNRGFEDGSAGMCNLVHGFVPSATLSISGQTNEDGLLVDPWGNPLRYSLAKAGSSNPDFSDPTSIKMFFSGNTAITSGMQVCSDSSCLLGPVHTNVAPAVVMSMGENWASYNPATSSQNERTNAGMTALGTYRIHDSAVSDLIFVSTDYSEENFDDQLVWLSPYVLFNRMVSAGKLP